MASDSIPSNLQVSRRLDCYGKDELGYEYPALYRPDADGDWCLYEDVKLLEAEIERLQGEWDKAATLGNALLAKSVQLRTALERATNFIGRWAAVYNAQERTVLAKEFREAEREARNSLRVTDETDAEHG